MRRVRLLIMKTKEESTYTYIEKPGPYDKCQVEIQFAEEEPNSKNTRTCNHTARYWEEFHKSRHYNNVTGRQICQTHYTWRDIVIEPYRMSQYERRSPQCTGINFRTEAGYLGNTSERCGADCDAILSRTHVESGQQMTDYYCAHHLRGWDRFAYVKK